MISTAKRHLVDLQTYRTNRSAALAEWKLLAKLDVPCHISDQTETDAFKLTPPLKIKSYAVPSASAQKFSHVFR